MPAKATASVTKNVVAPAPPQTSPQSKTWVVPCSPGPRPIWVAPNPADGEELVTWADPSDLQCFNCRFVVGPEDPDEAGPKQVSSGVNNRLQPSARKLTVPFEIIATTNTNAGPTGRSMLDMLGKATWVVQQLARQRGRSFGLCRQAIRPPCGCGCPVCVCGVAIDRTWLPSNVYMVLRVRVNGFEVPEWQPTGPITSIVTADPAVATVAWFHGGWQVTGVAAGKTQITWTRDGAHGPELVTTSIEVTDAPGAVEGANANRVVVKPGRVAGWSVPPRRNWRVDTDVAGHAWLSRLDPYSSCGSPYSTCGCAGHNPEQLPRWPQEQRIDLPATEDCTWEIEVLVGEPVPDLGRDAVAALACEFAKDAVNDDCRIPPEVTRLVRSGVTIDLQKVRNLSGITSGWGIEPLKMFLELALPPRVGYLDLESDPWMGQPTPTTSDALPSYLYGLGTPVLP